MDNRNAYALRYSTLMAVSILLLTGCKTTPPQIVATVSPPTNRPQTPQPVYGWKSVAEEKVELQALDLHGFAIPNAAKLRISVNADSGIFGGVFDRQTLTGKILRERQFASSHCPLLAVIQGETTCKVGSDSKLVYIVRDKRSEIAVLDSGLFAKFGDVTPLARATAPNRVAVKIDEWGCVANCRAPTMALKSPTPTL